MKSKVLFWVGGIVYVLLLAVLYYPSLAYLVSGWDGDYSYAYLIPLVILYLLWEKRRPLRENPSKPSWIGVLPFVFGVFLFWLGELGGEYLTLYFSFWFVLVGILWMHFGTAKIKIMAFPLILIPTMFRLPAFLHNRLTVELQLLASKIGVALIQLAGLSVYREGNVIDLGFTQLQVVEACSGLRYLFPLIVLGLLLAYFFRGAFWKRAILVISTVPLAIFSNSLRIALTGILSELWSPEAAEGFFHGFSGWFIFMFSLGVLLIEMWILSKIAPKPVAGIGAADKDSDRAPSAGTGISVSRTILNGGFFCAGIVVLGATLLFSRSVDFREQTPPLKDIRQFPATIGEWKGTRLTIEPEVLAELDLSQYVFTEYLNPQGQSVNLYVAYYESQRKGESIHSPETCLPGSGWLFDEAGSVTLRPPGPDERPLTVNRAFMQKLDRKQLSYYWFPQRGRNLTNAYQLKWYVFWDALTMQRTDGALVRIITPVYPVESLEEADKRLTRFTWLVAPLLETYLPGRELE
ncbi:MAG: VPLPA-CTERM-specific exosortase XrtD [Deltaproteobacteria bacterium]|nr:VPLPA-CTERM-specific exosortase XrtD [Deltaproteobacteria bacterium]